ncbi:putative ATPase, AAA+ superfamily [Halomicrobium sp. LC1Hm]|nr:putative ATPase, AAA+ superfamily [Halomicrobium sp. LC1Hm]
MSGEVRELAKNGDIGLPVLAEAGLVDSDSHDILLRIKRHSPEGTDDDRFQRILERELSKNLREGVVRGHGPLLNHLTGLSKNRSGLEGYRTIEELESLWRDYPAFAMYVYAPTPPEGPVGVGKTDFSYFVGAEVGRRVYPDLSIASNVPSDEFTTFSRWSEVEDWLKHTDGKKLFVLDEAAQVLQFADMSEGKVLSKLLKLIRKYDGNIILIGHTGRDVPRDVRRQLLVCRKDSKTKATIGTGLNEENEEIKVADVHMRLDGIPATEVEYDTLDEAEFVFDVEDGDDEDGGGDWDECRVEECGQSIGIDADGFCPAHDSDDLPGDGESGDSDELDAAGAIEQTDVTGPLKDGLGAVEAVTDEADVDAEESEVALLTSALYDQFDVDDPEEAREMAREMVNEDE